MGKSKKKSATKVEAAPPASMTKPLKKGKRDAEQDLDIHVSKKQKKALAVPPVQKEKAEKPIPKKLTISSSDSSDSSDSVEEQKTKKVIAKEPPSKLKDESSEEEDESSSDEEPALAPVKKQPTTVLKNAKVESSSSEDGSSEDESSSDEEPAPIKTQPTIVKKESSSEEESEEDEISSDEETAPVMKQPTVLKKAKADSSSSDDESSSDEEPAPAKKQPIVVENPKAESGSSEDESSSDEESAPVKKLPVALKNAKAESSSSDDESSSDEEPTPAKKQPSVVKNAKPAAEDSSSSEEDSDDEESDDEKPPTKKAKVSLTKTSEQESSSDESSDESDEEESKDEKVTPKKKDSDIEMVDAEQKSNAKQPKTPTTQTQGGSKTLFVGNLSYKIERSDLENFFKEAGEVVDVRIAVNEDGRLRGFGHVQFASAEAAQKALELNGKPLLGREVRLDLSQELAYNTPRSNNPGRKAEGSQSRTLFVRGFNSSVGEDEIKSALRSLFSTCGEVTRIAVPTDRETGAIRGMAYIDLKNGFNEALQLSGSDLGGWNITVQEARPRESGEGSVSKNRAGWGEGDRSSNRGPVRGGPVRGGPVRGGPGRVGPNGRVGRPGRGPSKPSVIASAQGKKTVFGDDDE